MISYLKVHKKIKKKQKKKQKQKKIKINHSNFSR